MLLAAGSAASLPADEAALTLEQAIALAMTANRTLAAARLARAETQAGVDIAGQIPNPEFSFEASKETPRQAYTLAFPIEMGPKRSRRIDLSEAATGSGEAQINRTELQIRVAVRRAYYTLLAAQRRADEMDAVETLAQRLRDAASDRFESGDVARLELVQADLNLAQADNDQLAARAEVSAARIDLNTLMARPVDQATTAAGDLDAGQLPGESAALDLAVRSSADLALLEREVAEHQARLNLAHAERVPDLVLQGAITKDAEPEFSTGWRAGLAVGVPLFNQHSGEIRLEEASLARRVAEREASLAQLRGLVSARLILASARRDRYLRYRDQILPRAAEVQRLAADAYDAGQTGLVTMLLAFGSVRDVRLKSVGSGLDYQLALADLEEAVGAPLP